ncbi:hypothetical protein FHX95_002883 [Clostridium saccharobutylicum]|nr:hypothetical protein [Clostridium saccharobutylicum]NYC29193.1 hypothetical protein [Clostridium saccharobutylicum]
MIIYRKKWYSVVSVTTENDCGFLTVGVVPFQHVP